MQVINSVAVSSSIPEIAGVLFVCSHDGVKIVATDSFRLSEKTLFKNKNYSLQKNNLLFFLQKAAGELTKIITPADETIEVLLAQNQVMFKLKHYPRVAFSSGEYPNYERIIPKQAKQNCLNQNRIYFKAQARVCSRQK